MNKKALWITIIAVIVIGVLIAKGGMMPRTPIEPTTGQTTSVTFYDQATGEALPATFTDNEVTFTSTTLGTVTLPHALSADGARYANADESLVFWNKGNSVFITQNGTIIFNGSVGEPAKPAGKLPAGSTAPGDPNELVGTWVWTNTAMKDRSMVRPNKVGKFTVTFDAQGHVGGSTDCNGYGGNYTVGSDGIIKMGSFISTQMYCEGSQEGLFTGQLMKVHRYGFDVGPNLQLDLADGAGTMIFTKK